MLDAVPEDLPPAEKIRLALRAHLRVVAEQLDVATVFIREWRYLEGDRREQFVAERRRYEERFRALFQEGRELGGLRTDLDDGTATLLALSAANWAYTWLRPGVDTDALADRFFGLLFDGIRGYATPSPR
jgi:TetR/AcrR family transcriptional regulator, cholesterol catabolism regulator